MNRMSKIIFLTILGLFIILGFSTPALAQDAAVVSVNPAALTIQGVKDKSQLSTVFMVTPLQEGLTKISFAITSSLPETGGNVRYQKALQPDQFTFSPSTLETPGNGLAQQVTLKVDDIQESGTWTGNITIQWQGSFTGTLNIPITVNVQAIPVLAQEEDKTILVQGNWQDQTPITRTVEILETSGSAAATGVRLSVKDILNANQNKQLPPQFFEGNLLGQDSIQRGERGKALLTFHLSGLPSGSYGGQIAVDSDNAAGISIPLKVEIKDPPLWPALAMIFGIVVGIGLTWYRSSVMPKDKVRVRMETLRGHLEKDDGFRAYCGAQKVNGLLVQADEYLRQDRPADAGNSLAEAEKLWDNWYANGAALMESLKAINALIASLENEGDNFILLPPVMALRNAMVSLRDHEIPEYAAQPLVLRDKIIQPDIGWEQAVDSCITIYRNLQEISGSLKDPARLLETAVATNLSQILLAIRQEFEAFGQPPTAKDLAPLQQKLATLRDEINAALAKAAQVQQAYNDHSTEAQSWLAQIDDAFDDRVPPPLGSVTRFIDKVILEKAKSLSADRQWTLANQMARNAWQGVQACRFIMRSIKDYRQNSQDAKWEAVRQCEDQLASWLVEETNFALEAQTFHEALYQKVRDLREELVKVVQQPIELIWSEMPASNRNKGLESFDLGDLAANILTPLLGNAGIRVEYISRETRPASALHLPWQTEFWTPGRRLVVANVITFVIGVGLLAAYGFKELYADIPTFGENGFMDYLKLVIWGFGAEAGRAQVIGLVKDWGIITPRSE